MKSMMSILTSVLVAVVALSLSGPADAGPKVSPDPGAITPQKEYGRKAAIASENGLITFDDYAINTPISNQYASKGVTFSGGFIELDNLPNPLFLSADNESFPSPYGNGLNAAPITAVFAPAVKYVQADAIYLDSGSQMTVTAYNATGGVVATASGSGRVRVDGQDIVRAVFTFSRPDGIDDIAGIDNLAFSTTPVVTLERADLVADEIVLKLSGAAAGVTGTATIGLVGDSGVHSITVNNGGQVGNGTYVVPMRRTAIPTDRYVRVQAEWVLGDQRIAAEVLALQPEWRVYGMVRHSQYNTPSESACPATVQRAWIFNEACNFTEVQLRSRFASQVYINGTGQSIEHGILKYSRRCASSRPDGASERNAFLVVAGITGACNVPMAANLQAAYPNPARRSTVTPKCGDATLLVENSGSTHSTRSIQDYCPACVDGSHIDNYSDVSACSGGAVGDLGNYWTANLGRN